MQAMTQKRKKEYKTMNHLNKQKMFIAVSDYKQDE